MEGVGDHEQDTDTAHLVFQTSTTTLELATPGERPDNGGSCGWSPNSLNPGLLTLSLMTCSGAVGKSYGLFS